MSIKVSRLKKFNPSMSVPGKGTVEIPVGMERAQGGRDKHNARHFANAMSPFMGKANSVDDQYTGGGEDSR